MAPKKALPPPPPPPEPEEEEETSEEESEESEEGEEGEESDVEEKEQPNEKTTQIQPSQVNKKPGVQKQTTPPPAAPESEEEEEGSESEEEGEGEGEEGEESDSPPSPNVSDFTVKPISPLKPASKDAKPTSKRSSDAQKDDEKDSRNRKKVKTNEGEEKKEKASASGGVGRVWSEEDEIAVLQGMIDYQNRKGADPSNDMAAFHEFIKGKLHADISKSQLYEKVRRFKKKFFTNVEKAESGEDLVFSKLHESKAFDLSKRIWGGGANSNGVGVDNVNAKSNDWKGKKGGKTGSISGIVKEGEKKGVAKVGSVGGIVKESEKDDVVMDDVGDDEGDFQSRYPHLSQSFDLDGSSFFPDGVKSSLKENLSLIDSVKARVLEEKWKKLREQEAEFFLKRMALMTEQTKLVLNAGKKSVVIYMILWALIIKLASHLKGYIEQIFDILPS